MHYKKCITLLALLATGLVLWGLASMNCLKVLLQLCLH